MKLCVLFMKNPVEQSTRSAAGYKIARPFCQYFTVSQYWMLKVLMLAMFAGLGCPVFAQSPGGVEAGLTFWRSADAGGFGATGTLIDPAINYNPAVQFNGVDDDEYYDIERTFQTVFVVSLLDGNASSLAPVLGLSTSSGLRSIRIETNTNWFCCDGLDFTTNLQTFGVGSNGSTGFQHPHILVAQAPVPRVSTNGFFIGGTFFAGGTPYINGLVSEIIAYDRVLTTAETAQVMSYLAIKYGVDLGQNLVSSSGTVVWNASTNSAYNQRVAGIGRDDLGILNQKQSVGTPAEALTIAAGSIEASNSSNTATLADQSFFLWGHNGNTFSDFTPLPSPIGGVTDRSQRIWKASNVGMNQALQLRFGISDFQACFVPGNLRLLVDDAADFSSPSAFTPSSSNATEVLFDLPAISHNHYFTLAYPLTPEVPTLTGPSSICIGEMATLQVGTGSLRGADQWVWYGGSCGGTQVGTGPSIDVSPTTTTTYYVRGEGTCILSPGACAEKELDVFIPEANAGTDQALCEQTSTTAIAAPATPFVGQWSVVSGTATLSSPNTPTTQVTGLVPGQTTTLRWTVTAAPTCLNSDDLVIINDINPVAVAGMDQTVCGSTSTIMAADDPSPGTGVWTLASGAGVIADPSSPTSLILNLLPGTTAGFRWTVASAGGGCPPVMDEVSISADIDINAAAGPDQIFCGQLTTTMSANDPSPGVGLWTVVSGTATIVSPTSAVTAITGLIPGQNTILRWTVSSPGGICVESDEMTIFNNIQPTANAGPDQSFCEQTSTTMAANNPGTGLGVWEILSGTATLGNLFAPNTSVTNIIPGIPITLRWTVSSASGGCEASDEVSIFSDALPVLDAGPDQNLCNQTTAQLNAADPLFGSGLWTLVSGVATIVSPTNPSTAITGLGIGNAILRWTVTGPLGICMQSDEVTLNNSGLLIADAGSDQNLCSANTAQLNAVPPALGAGVWTVESGTANITNPAAANTQVTGLIPGQTVTLRWTITSNSGACSGFDEMLIINEVQPIANASADQSLCQQGGTQLDATPPSSGTGLWSVVSGSANIDNPSDPASNVSGLIPGQSATLRWTVTSASGFCTAFDEMTIVNEAQPTINAGPDQYICDLTSTQMQAVLSPGSSGFWSVLVGTANILNPTSPTTTVTGLTPPDDVLLQWTITSASGLCVRSAAVNLFTFISPVADAGPDQTLCAANSATLMANAGGSWSVVSGTGNIADAFDPNTTVTGLVPGTSITLRWTVTGDPCSASDEMTIFNETIPVADAGPDQNLCSQTSASLSASVPSSGTGVWTVENGTANITNPTAANTQVTGLVPGQTVTLRWTVTTPSGVCAGFDEMLIVNEVQPIANASADQALCQQGGTQLDATPPSSGTGLWSVVSGSANIDNPSDPVSNVSGLIPGQSTTLRWTVTSASGFCTAFDEMTIVNEAQPAINAGPDQYICDLTTTQMQAVLPPGASGVWSVLLGTANILSPNSPTTTVTGLTPPDDVLLQWTITSASGLCVRSAAVNLFTFISPVADAGPDQTLCAANSATLMANAGGSWSVVSGTGNIADAFDPNTTVTGLVPGTSITLRWTVTGDPCSASDEMTIFNESIPVADAGPDQNLCSQTSAALSANVPSSGTGVWTVESGAASITNPAAANTQVTGLVPGENVILRWTVTTPSGVCSNFDEVLIVNEIQPVSNAGADQILCQVTTGQLGAVAPVSGTGLWSVVSGNVDIDTPTSATSGISGLIPGETVVLRWTVSSTSGFCVAADNVNITNEILPTANAGSDQNLCNQTATTISATPPTMGTGMWSVTSGTANIVSPNAPNSQVTGLIAGETVVLRWTVTSASGVCSVFDEKTIANDLQPVANAGSDQVLCNQTETQLNASAPTAGTGAWSIVLGSATIVDPANPNTQLLNLMPGQNTALRWTLTSPSGACIATDNIIIFNDIEPTADAGADQALCNQTTAQLHASTPTTGVGVWSVVSGTANLVSPFSPTTQVTSLTPGQNVVLRWTVSSDNAACSVFDETTIVNDLPALAQAGPDQILCNQTSTNLAATPPTSGGGIWTIVAGAATVVSPDLPNSQVSGLVPGQTARLRWTVTGANGICQSFDEVLLISDLPVAASAGDDQWLCQQTSTQLEALVPASGTGLWSIVSGTGVVSSPNIPISQLTNLIPGQSVTLRWTVTSTNGACSEFDEVLINNDLQVSANAGPDQNLCDQTTAQLNAQAPLNGVGAWGILSGVGNIAQPNNNLSQITGLIPGQTVTLRWTVTGINGICIAEDDVTLVNDIQVIAEAGADQALCNQTSTQLSATVPASGTGIWTVINGTANITTPENPNTQLTGLVPGQNVSLRWTVKSTNETCTNFDDVLIVNDLQPNANAGANQVLCDETSAQLQAIPPISGIGTWSVVSGTATVISPSSPSSLINGLIPGEAVTLRWTVTSTSGVCSSEDDISITNDLQPIANAGSDQAVCNQSSISLNADGLAPGLSGIWSVVSGFANFTAPTSPNSSITGLATGQQSTLRWTVASISGVCSDADEVVINNDAQPLANAGVDQTLCNTFTAILSANAAVVGTGAWSIVSGMGNFDNANSPNAAISGLDAGETVLRWTIDPQNACATSASDITLTVYDPAPVVTTTSPLCAGQELVLTVDGDAVSSVNWGGPAGFSSNDPYVLLSNVQPVNAGTYTVTVTQANGCSESTSVVVEVDAIPVAQAGPDQLLCNTTTAQLNAFSSTGFGEWTLVSGTAVIDDPSLANTTLSGLQNGSVVLRWTVNSTGGSFCTAFDEVQLTVGTAGTVLAGVDQSICYNTNTILNASLGSGNTGLWSVVNGTGTFANPTAPNSAVSGLSNGTNTFRWTVSGTGCGTGFDEVVVNVVPSPGVPNAGTDQTVCGATSTQLAATPPVSGTGFWQLVSGTGVFSDPNSPTSLVNGLTQGQSSTFRWNVQNGTCPVLSDLVLVSVGTTPAPANAGPNQQLCYVSNTTLAAVAPGGNATGTWSLVAGSASITNPNAPNSAVTGLSAGTTVLRWTVNTPGCPSSSADVSLSVTPSPGTAQAGPDQNFCGLTTTQLAATPVTVGQGSWQIVSGSAVVTSPNAPNSTLTNLVPGQNVVLQWNISNGTCPVLSDQVNINVVADPQPAAAGPDQSLCYVGNAILGATAVPGTGNWRVVTGTAIFSNANSPNSAVSGLSPGINTLEWTVSNGAGCPTTTDRVDLVVLASPGMPNAGPDQVLCSTTSAQLSATPVSAGQGVWQLVSGTAVITNPNAPNSTLTNLVPGQNVVLQWNISNGTCPILTDQVNINVVPTPQPAQAGPDQSLCYTNTTVLNAIQGTGAGTWSVVSGTAVFSNPSAANSGVSGLAAGLNLLQWTVNNGANCPSSTDQVAIVVTASPGTPNAGPDQTLCATTTATLAAVPLTVGQGNWQVLSGPGTISDPSAANSTINNLAVGQNTVLQWTISNGNCPGLSDQLTLRVISDPQVAQAGADQSLCYAGTTTLDAVPVPGNGFWVLVSGNAVLGNANDPKSAVTGLATGLNTLRWVVDNGNTCPVTTDEVNITVTESPGNPNAGPDQLLCNTTVTQLAALAPVAGQGQWQLISGSATLTDPNTPNSTVTGLVSGQTTVLQWNISNGGCPVLTDRVSISVLSDPQPAQAGADQTLCYEGNAILNATQVPGIGTWSVLSGTAVFANPNAPNSSVSGLANGLNVLQWSVNNGAGCPLTTDEVRITITASPGIPNAGPDIAVCNTTVAQLAATPPLAGQGRWQIVSGNAVVTDPSSPVSTVANLVPGQNVVLQWIVSNENCPVASDEMTIRVNIPPSSDAGTNQTICYGNQAMLSAMPANGTWSVSFGSATFANTGAANTTVSGLADGLNVLQWTVQNIVGCPPVTDQVIIEVVPSPGLPNAGNDQTLCLATSATLSAAAVLAGQGAWQLVSGTGSVSDPSLPVTQVSGLTPGQTSVFEWTVSNGTCPFLRDTVALHIFGDPQPVFAGADQQLCYVSSTQLNANPTTGTGTWSIVTGTGTFFDKNAPNTDVSGLGIGTNVLQWTVDYGAGCTIVSDQLVLENIPSPGVALAGPDQLICNGTQAQLNAVAPVNGNGIWKLVSGTAIITDPSNPNSMVINLIEGESVVLRWEIQNGANCPALGDELTITIQPAVIPADAGQDRYLCYTNSLPLDAAPAQQGTGVWSIVSGTAAFVDATNPKTNVSALPAGITVLLWTVNYNNGCPATTDQVVLEFVPPPSAANAGPDQNLCGVTQTQLAAVPLLQGQGAWRLVSGIATIDDPSAPNTPISGMPLGTSAVFSWDVSNGSCPVFASDAVSVSVITGNIVANAGSDQSICGGNSVQLNALLPSGTGMWSMVSGAGVFSNKTDPKSTITGLSAGENILRWTLMPGPGCTTTEDEVRIFYTPVSMANAGPDQSLCAATTSQLLGNSPIFGTGQWTLLSGIATLANPTAANASLSDLNPGTNVLLRWTVVNGVCPPASDTILIQNALLPSPANAGADVRVCESAPAQLAAVVPLVGTGQWQIVNGTGTISMPTAANSLVTGLTPGATATLRWTVSNGSCPANIDDATVLSDRLPSIANAGQDAALCTLTQYALQASAPLVGSGTWSVVGGTGTLGNPIMPQSSVTGLTPGATTTLRWTVSNGVCPASTDQVEIRVDQNPSPANAGPDLKVCDSEVMLAAVEPAIGMGAWSILNGTGQLVDATDAQTVLGGLTPPSTVLLRWTVRNGVCPVVGDEILVTVNLNTLNPQAGADQTLCDANITSVRAQNPPPGATGQWSVLSGNAVLGTPNSPLTTVSNLGGGQQVVLLWTLVNSTCPPVSDTLVINNGNSNALAVNFLISETACTNDTVHLIEISDTLTTFNLSYRWEFGDGTISTERDPIHIYPNPGMYGVRLITQAGSCVYLSLVKTINILPCRQPEHPGNRTFLYGQVSPTLTEGPFELFLKLNRTDQAVTVRILTAEGRLYETRTLTPQTEMTAHFELGISGLYFVEVTTGNRDRMLFRVARVD